MLPACLEAFGVSCTHANKNLTYLDTVSPRIVTIETRFMTTYDDEDLDVAVIDGSWTQITKSVAVGL